MRKTLLTTLFLLCLFGVASAQVADHGGRVSIDPNAVSLTPQFSTFKSAKKSAPVRDASAVFFDDFESGDLNQWTIYTMGESPNADGWVPYNVGADASFFWNAHSGNYVASAWSFTASTSYNSENWLVTPQVALGGTLKFWVLVNRYYPDSYEVKLSTAGNAISDFTVTLQEMAIGPTTTAGVWTEVTIDLSAYEGQQGYIAIHHQANNKNYLFIDDFGIYAEGGGGTNELTVFPEATDTHNRIPAFVFYWDDWTKSQCVIPASELTSMAGGTITSMKFYTTAQNVPYTSVSTADFFLKEVESETIDAYVDKADATVVYSGTIEVVAAGIGGEVTITFTTPFTYNGGNLLIGSENTTDADYKNIYFIGEIGHDGASIAGSNGSSLDNVLVTNYDFLPKTTFTYTGGSTPPTPTVETPTNVQVSEITENSAKVSWDGTDDSFTLRYRPAGDPGLGGDATSFSVDFESGLPEGWTVIDGNNDGWTWCLTSEIPTTWTYYASLSLDWYRSGSNAICSGSYINGVGALTPDEYLVTPQVTLVNGSTFSFWAAATDGNYPADHFGVFVSDDGTSNWTSVQEWTMTAAPGYPEGVKGAARVPKAPQRIGTWYQYSVDLSAYAGQKYIAIRHFNCNDEYIMTVDDIELSAGTKAAAWQQVTTTDNFAELTGLTAETEYEVQVQGVAGSLVSEWSPVVQFTTLAAAPVVPAPTDLVISDITSNSAVATWTGTNDSHTLRYRPVESVAPGDGNWYSYCEGQDNEDAIGTGSGQFYWAIMLPAGSYTGNQVLKVSAYDYMAMTGTVTIYNDGDTAPASAVGSTDVTFTGSNEFVEFTFDTPVAIDNTKNVWVVFFNESGATYPAAVCADTGDANGRWVSLDGVTWEDMAAYGLNYSYMIKAYIANASSAPMLAKKHVISMLRSEAVWTTMDVSETTANLTGLDPETEYEVQVQGITSGETSEWSDVVTFTTLAAPVVPAPTDLAVSNITDQSATVTWNGDADGYEMELGVAGSAEVLAVYDFSDGTLQGWTNLVVNSDGGQWVHSNNNPSGNDYSYFMTGQFAMCYSYVNSVGAFDTDAYLVSPQAFDIVAGSTLTFKATFANIAYPENITVCVAETTGTPTAADFTVVATPTINTYLDNSTEVTVDLSAYAGKSIWIAFHDQNYDKFEIWIDDIAISGAKMRWTSIGDVTSPYDLTGLDPETEYSVRVRGVSGSATSDWVTTTFTTLAAVPAVDVPTDLAISDITATSAVATWTGTNDSYTLRYRPVEEVVTPVPGDGDTFSVDFEDSAIPEGWTTIDNGTPSGYGWMIGSEKLGDTGKGHNGSVDFILSQSYDNNYGVVYPDNYLISPKVAITAGSTFSFWACGQDASYAAEHFGVAISTTGTSASDFTMVQEWTMTAAPGMYFAPGEKGNFRGSQRTQGAWYQYTVDLSYYAGQEVYIAIRHFNCSDMFYLDVDDIELSVGRSREAEWTRLDVTEPTAELTDLTPETTYEVQVQGITGGNVSEWSDVVTFTTSEATGINRLNIAGQENWYTIDGRKLAKRPTTTGVYILNGSKVMIK